MRHKPVSYRGLTIVLSNPSRFDSTSLLSGNAGSWFLSQIQKASGLSTLNLDIRTLDTIKDGYLPNTKVVFALGEQASKALINNEVTLNQQRGSPAYNDGIVFISSYTPQDAFDVKNYESRLNEHLVDLEDDDDESEATTKGSTKRQNFKFWLSQDLAKVARILKTELETTSMTEVLRPAMSIITKRLNSVKAEDTVYLDIETTMLRELTCVGFAVNDGPCYVVPIRLYDGSLAYSVKELCLFMKALSKAQQTGLTVTHNGHTFDWLVLAHHYRIPFGRNLYDTMIAQNRRWPYAEKSLGHCMSLYTDEPYHKDEGVFETKSEAQDTALWQYNAKDVHGMRLIKKKFDAVEDQGYQDSVRMANKAAYVFMIATLKGIKVDAEAIEKLIKANDAMMARIQRITLILLGPALAKLLRDKSDSTLLSSSKQASQYFFTLMKYPNKVKTETGEDACNALAMYKLLIYLRESRIDNPIPALRLRFAKIKKETSTLRKSKFWFNSPYK